MTRDDLVDRLAQVMHENMTRSERRISWPNMPCRERYLWARAARTLLPVIDEYVASMQGKLMHSDDVARFLTQALLREDE